MRNFVLSVAEHLRSLGFKVKAAVTRPVPIGPFRVPAEAIIVTLQNPAHVRLIDIGVPMTMSVSGAANYVLMSMPWTVEEAEEQFNAFLTGYRLAGLEVEIL